MTRAELERFVVVRAGNRCEYCRMHQSLQGATFHIEHCLPSVLGGEFAEENLALACPRCNLCKSDRTHAHDPATGAWVPIYHPRVDEWTEHFEWQGFAVVGTTETGRATVEVLDLNQPRRLLIRQAESMFGFFPP